MIAYCYLQIIEAVLRHGDLALGRLIAGRRFFHQCGILLPRFIGSTHRGRKQPGRSSKGFEHIPLTNARKSHFVKHERRALAFCVQLSKPLNKSLDRDYRIIFPRLRELLC